MTLDEFKNRKSELGIDGSGITSTVLRDIKWINKQTGDVSYSIPLGDKVHVYFSPQKHSTAIFIVHGDQVKQSRVTTAYGKLSKFQKEPSMRTLEKQNSNGVVSSVTGYKVEPDGQGPDGSPSWLLVLGGI